MQSILYDKRATLLVFLVAGCALLATATGPAQAGNKVTREGVTHVVNAAQPNASPETLEAKELWRAGGDDESDEVIFGVLADVAVDANDNVYLLDQQLSEVYVFSPDGEYLRSIGREGEGPGEFRRANRMFITGGNEVAVMQMRPGKVVLFTTEGDPAGEMAIPKGTDGGMLFFSNGGIAGNDLVLAVREFARKETGFEITEKLIRVSGEGEVAATYHTQTRKRDMAKLVFNEKADVEPVWACGNDGRVYMNDNFDAYTISVYEPDGTLSHVIERPYEHRRRSAEDKERNKPRMIVRRGNQTVEAESIVSETDRDVVRMYPREDGTLWVINSRGAFDDADGVVASFDVFDRDGNFSRQVSIRADGNFRDDGLHLIGDRMFVVKNLDSAREAMFGGEHNDEEYDEEDIEPISVVAYDIGRIVRAGK